MFLESCVPLNGWALRNAISKFHFRTASSLHRFLSSIVFHSTNVYLAKLGEGGAGLESESGMAPWVICEHVCLPLNLTAVSLRARVSFSPCSPFPLLSVLAEIGQEMLTRDFKFAPLSPPFSSHPPLPRAQRGPQHPRCDSDKPTGTRRQNQLQEDVSWLGAHPARDATGRPLAVDKTIALRKLLSRCVSRANV